MHIKTADGTYNVGSQGVAGAGLGLGIAGTALGLLNGGLGFLGLGGNMKNGFGYGCGENSLISSLFAHVGSLTAEKYADNVGIGVYNAVVSDYKELRNFISQLDKEIAVEKQSTRDNFAFLNNEIHNTKKEIFGYVNSHFVPGKLVMPLESIEPKAMRRYNTWVAPTAQAPDNTTEPTT